MGDYREYTHHEYVTFTGGGKYVGGFYQYYNLTYNRYIHKYDFRK